MEQQSNKWTQTVEYQDPTPYDFEDSQIETNLPTCDLEERLQNSNFSVHNSPSIVFNEEIDLPRQDARDITLQASYFKPDTF
jgi:hypothetical protein